MSVTEDLATKLTSPKLDKTAVRAFAEHVAGLEAQAGLKPTRALINGIPVFPDIPTVEFKVPKAKLADVMKYLLGNSKINPNILINGIPSVDHYHISVMAGH